MKIGIVSKEGIERYHCEHKKGEDHWFFGHYHEDKMIGAKMVLLYGEVDCFDSLADHQIYFHEKRNLSLDKV